MHKSKLLKFFWVGVNPFKIEGQETVKRQGSVQGINTKKRGQSGCLREKPNGEDPHGEITLNFSYEFLPLKVSLNPDKVQAESC